MKVEREAFVYLEPKSRDGHKNFAQCASCRMFVPKVKGLDGSRCIIHGSSIDIDSDDSCGFWCDWPTLTGSPNLKVIQDHAAELEKSIPGSVLPSESGLVDDRVQCHRCEFYIENGPRCGLYEMLNKILPTKFNMNPNIEEHACCNAWTERDNSTKGWASRRNAEVAARKKRA